MSGAMDDLVRWDEAAWRSRSRNRTFMLPDVLSERLDTLVRVLHEAGVRSNRAEIVAALLLAVEPNADHLDHLIRTYRRASVADAYSGEAEGTGLQLKAAHPGPRPRG